MSTQQTTQEEQPATRNVRLAVIRLKGKTGLQMPVKKTLDLLRLYKKNHCIVISNTPQYIGMIQRVQHTITWGEIDEETFKNILEKRGKLPAKESLTPAYLKEKIGSTFSDFAKKFMAFQAQITDIPGLKPFFKLSPPRQGLEKKGLKAPYSMGGSMGYRKDNINDLIRRMM